jgi:hypothetical protein
MIQSVEASMMMVTFVERRKLQWPFEEAALFLTSVPLFAVTLFFLSL